MRVEGAGTLAESPAFPWSVPYEAIRALSDTALTAVMKELIVAEAHLRSSDISSVSINSEEKAADSGCDGWSPQTSTVSPWLGSRETCWQFKAGKAGEPNRLKREVAKPTPRATLEKGGRFIVVTSAAVSGEPGRRARLKVLVAEAKKLRLPTAQIEVMTSETLWNWLNEHPAIAGALLGLPAGYWTMSRWKQDIRHTGGWFPSKSQKDSVSQLQQALSISGGTVHVHIHGRPGVGKTRLALEACATAPWANTVLYVPQPAEADVLQLIERVAQSRANLVLVVDEALPDRLSTWGAAAHLANGRIRLLTIGHSRSQDSIHLTELEIEPLDREPMLSAIRAWHPNMPAEQHEFILDFSDGYIRLARLTGDALAKNPEMNARDLFRDHKIKTLMAALLGPTNERRKLHVVAALTSVGWEGARADEGAAVAKHLGLNWDEVRVAVQEFDERMGIAPRAGDLRYISPVPLGVYLAIEAWESNRESMKSLYSVLPTEAARRAYNERLQAVIASPSAREFAQEQLRHFLSWDNYTQEPDAELWAAISRADPIVAASQTRRALEHATREERLQIRDKARRLLVTSLVDLAWGATTFKDAVLALAYLADAENETWANNASGEFRSRFQVFLGGTSAPYMERLKVIDSLLHRSEDSYWKLSVEALSRVGETHASRMAPRSKLDAAREPEWQPRTGQDHLDAINAAMDRLDRIAENGRPALKEPLAKAADRLRRLLRYRRTRDLVARYLRLLVTSYPELKRETRQDLRQLINLETDHWRELPAEDVGWLEALYAEFEDRSPGGRLRELVGMRGYEIDLTKFDAIAGELISSPSLLESHWGWLTSGEAVHAWHLGEVLARVDTNLSALPRLLRLHERGPDVRFIAGYLYGAAKTRELSWVDDLLDRMYQDTPNELAFIAELSWRCSSTDRSVERLAGFADRGDLPISIAEQLVFGGWSLALSRLAFERLLRAFIARQEYRPAALALAEHRLSKRPDEWATLEGLVLELLGDVSLIKGSDMTEYHWIRMARRLLPSHVRRVAALLMEAQSGLEERSWFLQHSQVVEVLSMCINLAPTTVWEELRPHLENRTTALRFTIGFPDGVLERLPHEEILAWVKTDRETRSLLIAQLIGKNLTPKSLGEKLLAAHGDLESLGNEYFSAWVAGGWWGPSSAHWGDIANQLKAVAHNTKEPAVADWARRAAESFQQMAARDRKREEEEEIRRR